ncbi:hypothetical protein [Nocardia sp. NPDC051750]|uniref:hypothetical protein n=1 Tax=Nocardia sp. NPDC051750 TaxID=3364325 RepID=UPI0037904D43
MSTNVDEADVLANEGRLTASLMESGQYCRWMSDWEVEAKFRIDDARDDPGALLEHILSEAPFTVDRVCDGDSIAYPVYRVDDGLEYSFFVYRGESLVKIKRHSIDELSKEFPVMVSTEHFLKGPSALRWRASFKEGLLGPLEKCRSKVFVHDLSLATCFSAAVTVCRYKGHTQKQFELEYYGSSMSNQVGSVSEIVKRVRRTALAIHRSAVVDFAPTTETKLDFLQRYVRSEVLVEEN